jgi:hypothetical protein
MRAGITQQVRGMVAGAAPASSHDRGYGKDWF